MKKGHIIVYLNSTTLDGQQSVRIEFDVLYTAKPASHLGLYYALLCTEEVHTMIAQP